MATGVECRLVQECNVCATGLNIQTIDMHIGINIGAITTHFNARALH